MGTNLVEDLDQNPGASRGRYNGEVVGAGFMMLIQHNTAWNERLGRPLSALGQARAHAEG